MSFKHTPSFTQVLPEASTLADTLDPKHDAFFAKLTKFGYKTCLGWYLPSNEVRALEEHLCAGGLRCASA